MPRVVWSLIREALNANPGTGKALDGSQSHSCQSTIFHDGKCFPYDSSETSKSLRMRSDILSFAPWGYRPLAAAVCKVVGNKALKRWLLPDAGHLGIFRPLVKKQVKREQEERQCHADWRKPGEGDILLLPDAYWSGAPIWSAVAEARRNGALVVSVMYDLIPLTHPQFVPEGSGDSFAEYVRKTAENSDLIFAISDTIRDECRAEISKRWPGLIAPENIGSFRLGADLPKSQGEISATISKLFSTSNRQTPYIMVSTFDPRKNHKYLLETFELFWETHPDASLCLIGGRGWMSKDLLDRIERHSRFGKQLFKFHSMADAELEFCYQHARGVICPSHVEGFGLPIVEALAYGRKAFLNDTRIHREIGKDDCEYFDSSCRDSLLKLLTRWEARLAAGQPVEQDCRRPTSWQEATNGLLAQCIHAYCARKTAGSKQSICKVA